MLTDSEAMNLGKALGTLIEERGLGALAKKDYELLVFHHLSVSASLRRDRNYSLANKLKVTEAKVKSLRLESSIRHSPANHKAVLGEIVQRILDEMNKPDFTGGTVSITLENPVDRREFEYAVKLAMHTVEYGINREILKIDALALFEIIFSNVENAEARFKSIVQSHVKARSRQQELLNKSLTFRQRVNQLGLEISSNEGATAMLSAGAALLL